MGLDGRLASRMTETSILLLSLAAAGSKDRPTDVRSIDHPTNT